MLTMRSALGHSLVRGLALLVLLVGTARAGDIPFYQYEVTGDRDGEEAEISGVVRFAVNSSSFRAGFNPNPVAAGATYDFTGSYAEIDLFFISLWSFEGGDNQIGKGASGSGIRLFFGLFVFGSLEASDGAIFSLSGVFDTIVAAAPPGDVPARIANGTGTMERTALMRRRSLAIEQY